MFDYTMLNDHEFEILCRDIMQVKLNESLFFFPRGVDQGIDICDKEITPSTMIQAKHYAKSTYSQLLTSLKKEIPKVKKHQPAQYFIMTTQSLTRKNKLEIRALFPKFMKDISFIWGKEDIDSFLKDTKNSNIVQQNFKLWLNASNVLSIIQNQNVLLDSEELLEEIKSKAEVFVITSSYSQAIEIMKIYNILIITGAPGVGKSTISEMVLLYYIEQGYVVRYVTNNNLPDLKKSISMEIDKKELILLDDFLGQHYLRLKEDQPNELKTLLSFVGRSSSKKIILNSRITILNEAREWSMKFDELMTRYDLQKYLIDLDKISKYEKAKILYNHLYFNRIPDSYFNAVKVDGNYMKIISHRNYNPRIIEYVTKQRNYESVPAGDYCKYILKKLNHPADIWRDEFENRMSAEDRCFMNTLYSLTDTDIEIDKLEHAFNTRIRNEKNIDTTTNHFERVMKRLTESLIAIKIKDGKQFISVLNPSINDYLLKELSANVNEQLKIIEHAVFFEQIIRCNKSEVSKESVKSVLCSDNVFQFKTLRNSIYYYFFELVVENELCDTNMYDKFRISIEQAYQNLETGKCSDYSDLIDRVLHNTMSEFYNLSEIFTSQDKLFSIVKNLSTEVIVDLFSEIKNDVLVSDNLVDIFKSALEDSIDTELQDQMMYEDSEVANQIVESESYNYDTDHELVESKVAEELGNRVSDKLASLYEDLPDELILNDDSLFNNILSSFNISDAVYDSFKSSEDSNSTFMNKPEEDDEKIIKAMFEK